jgi:hypothetical protein
VTSTKLLPGILLFLILRIMTGTPRAAEFGFEFSNSQGSTQNLLDDSSKIFDTYTNSALRVAYYPLPSLEIDLSGENSYYRELTGLSGQTGQFGMTFIPLPESSRISLYLSGDVSGVRYHNEFSAFENTSAEIEAAAGYAITDKLNARAGVAYSSTAYIALDVPYKRDFELYWGGNLSLFGVGSLDIETGFARANYTYIVNDTINYSPIILPIISPDSLPNAGADLWMYFISPRLSGQIAPKTGLSLLFSRRNFQNYHRQIIYGFSTSYLSPWAGVWQGQEVSASLKSYLVPHIILTAGAGYWDKRFMKTAEEEHLYWFQAVRADARHDYQSRYYVNIQWPITTKSHIFIEPNLRLDYTNNRSNKALYYFDDFSVSAAIKVRL